MAALRSWTEIPEVRLFSGRATYETTVDIPDPGGVRRWTWGAVRGSRPRSGSTQARGCGLEAALPGERHRLLRKGANQIRVVAGNTLLNHVLSQPAKDYSDVQARYPAIGNRIPVPREKELAKEPCPRGCWGRW